MPAIRRIINPPIANRSIIAKPRFIRPTPVVSAGSPIITRRTVASRRAPILLIGDQRVRYLAAPIALMMFVGFFFVFSQLAISLLATTLLIVNLVALNNAHNSNAKRQQTVGLSVTAIVGGLCALGLVAAYMVSFGAVFLPLTPFLLINIPVAFSSIAMGAYYLATDQANAKNTNAFSDDKINDGKQTQEQQNTDKISKPEQAKDEKDEKKTPSGVVVEADSVAVNPKSQQSGRGTAALG